MSKQSLTIVHLYPKEMNIYGDTGNRLTFERRAKWRDIDIVIKQVGVGDPVPDNVDFIFGGGGQDAVQGDVQHDLLAKGDKLRKLAEDGVVMLMICGMYQLFGREFLTHEGQKIAGLGVFPMKTVGGKVRMIGNTVYDTPYGEIVGYENHSGMTMLEDTSLALGAVKQGSGNNGQDGTEGARVHNAFGTYSHGPVLPKNPQFADELLRLALERKYGTKAVNLKQLNDTEELLAQETAKSRPR